MCSVVWMGRGVGQVCNQPVAVLTAHLIQVQVDAPPGRYTGDVDAPPGMQVTHPLYTTPRVLPEGPRVAMVTRTL